MSDEPKKVIHPTDRAVLASATELAPRAPLVRLAQIQSSDGPLWMAVSLVDPEIQDVCCAFDRTREATREKFLREHADIGPWIFLGDN